MKYLVGGTLLVSFLFFIVMITNGIDNSYRKDIQEWVSKRNEKVISIEQTFLYNGPYIITKNTNIYKVKTDKGVYWFRFGFLYNDIEMVYNGEYKKLR